MLCIDHPTISYRKLALILYIGASFTIGSVNSKLSGQKNLVPNYSFEEYTQCPDGIQQFDRIVDWIPATDIPPSFFNSCSPNPWYRVPHAGYFSGGHSYQYPRTGQGHALIEVYSDLIRHDQRSAHLNYVQVKLNAVLQSGERYYVEWFVVPDVRTRYWKSNDYVSKVGAAFSDTLVYEEPPIFGALSIRPTIEHDSTQFITDSVNWTRVSGCFVADGTEQYIVIGNFYGTNETPLLSEYELIAPKRAHLFIDDVGVYEYKPLPDTLVLCSGSSETLGSTFLDATYLWNTGVTEAQIAITEPGVYTVDINIGDCFFSDTTVVLDGSPEPTVFDTTICVGQEITLSPGYPGRYVWSDGQLTSTIRVSNEGSYTADVVNECGEHTFTADVKTERCDCRVYAPNSFSPNDDGVNDYFRVFYDCGIAQATDFDLKIYGRWGNLIQSVRSREPPAWDGKLQSADMDAGVYFWTLSYSVEGQLRRSQLQGSVKLIR